MDDKIRGQQRRFMAYNLIAFTLIFTLFGAIVYSLVSTYLFSPVDGSLLRSREGIEMLDGFVERQLQEPAKFRDGGRQPEEPPGDGPGEEPGKGGYPPQSFLSTRVLQLLRDGEGNILNPHMLGHVYWDGYLDSLPLDLEQAGRIVGVALGEGSHYHSLTFSIIAEDGETYYVQLLANVDGELAIIDNFLRILVICVAGFILLSITASYILSRTTMKPVIRAWNRQTEFVENASHELRTPLTIIQNKLEGMLAAPNATVYDRADDVVVSLSETRRLSKLTSDLMTLARADSNETLLEKKTLNLDDLVTQVSEPYRELAQMEDKAMTLKLAGGEIEADRSRIHQLMVILLDNALKYTREGDEIAIRTARRDSRVILEVADTGIGIGEESLSRIFDRFYREDKARSRQSGGSGLGLAIAKWIVDTHGGTIKAMPNGQKGTVFQVVLK